VYAAVSASSKLRLCGIYNYSHLLSIAYYAISIMGEETTRRGPRTTQPVRRGSMHVVTPSYLPTGGLAPVYKGMVSGIITCWYSYSPLH
jgi:hypothetical protein